MLARKRLIGVAKLVLGAMLFAQAALALAACDWGRPAPAQAFAAMDAMPCCQDDEARPDALAGTANLCLMHCTSDAQSVDTSKLLVPTGVPLAVLTVPPVPTPGCFALRGVPFARHAFATPPLTILFQNFRI